MKNILVFLGLMLGLAAPTFAPTQAMAQNCGVNYVPQIGINCNNIRQNTYSAAILKLVPAASATDFFCINGSSSKNIHVLRWEITGTGTAAGATVYLNHNLGLDTGTAAVVGTYGPVPNPYRSSNPAATAATVAYNSTGGNPTIGGTVTTMRSGVLAIAANTNPNSLFWTFGTPEGMFAQSLDIPSGGTTEQYCLNLSATSVTAVLDGYVEWTED